MNGLYINIFALGLGAGWGTDYLISGNYKAALIQAAIFLVNLVVAIICNKENKK